MDLVFASTWFLGLDAFPNTNHSAMQTRCACVHTARHVTCRTTKLESRDGEQLYAGRGEVKVQEKVSVIAMLRNYKATDHLFSY